MAEERGRRTEDRGRMTDVECVPPPAEVYPSPRHSDQSPRPVRRSCCEDGSGARAGIQPRRWPPRRPDGSKMKLCLEASASVGNGLRAVPCGTTRRSCPTKIPASSEVSVAVNGTDITFPVSGEQIAAIFLNGGEAAANKYAKADLSSNSLKGLSAWPAMLEASLFELRPTGGAGRRGNRPSEFLWHSFVVHARKGASFSLRSKENV